MELSDEEIETAERKGREISAGQPHAVAVRYDLTSDRVIVDLSNGATFAFPPRLVQGLAGAKAAALAEVELLGRGFGLHWEQLDVDISVQGLLAGVFGTRSYMAGVAGRAKSAAKAAAARSNGAKGGRPRKSA